jgi:sirohydrochlorin cobaltochelatase/precorrin-2/cobalt-factor-2 C20-methyltransferase
MAGILYGVGVGPGDPELLTLKAVRIIRESDLLLLPTEEKEKSYAYQIAKQVLPEIDSKEILCHHFPMVKDRTILEQAQDEIYQIVKFHLDQGKQIAFLTIGDPGVYSTYTYIHQRALADGQKAMIINGIPSFCAVAARLGIPLGEKKEQIHVIPGTYDIWETDRLSGTRIYMKSGKALGELRHFLEQESREKNLDIYGVTNCGMETERVFYGLDEMQAENTYLTTVIVKEKQAE